MWKRVLSIGRRIHSPAVSLGGFRAHSTLKTGPSRTSDHFSLAFSVKDNRGALQSALQHFSNNEISLTRIESRPNSLDEDCEFLVDFKGPDEEKVNKLVKELKGNCKNVVLIGSKDVPWFPRKKSDIDYFTQQTLEVGEGLEADHPGFNDEEYRSRRDFITRSAKAYRSGQPEIPFIEYKESEKRTWGTIYDKLMPLIEKHACKEYLAVFPELSQECKYSNDNIPQLNDISKFLQRRTGFSLRPVAGLLSPRDFFNGLAFRVFFSTQYIRHHGKPLYTPEPDVVHELLGHAPMFADAEFADFSQEVGLASIGASEEQITALARCYWYTVEFGVCQEDGKRKAYGAGLLSSFGELEYAMSDKPEFRDWDPFVACQRDYPITTYQPLYFVAKTFSDANIKMKEFSKTLQRPFHVRFNKATGEIEADRNLNVLPKED